MADKEKKSTMKGLATNDQANYYSEITSITVNGKNAYELKGKFLEDLCNNAFSGANGKDAVEHIEFFLRIVDLIDLPNVNQDKLRVVFFPILLVGDAWRWFDEIKGSITSWVDLTAKCFGKYYPPSRTGKINTLIIKWDPTNRKFENWLASKFVNYKTMDIFTKGALWDYRKLGSDEIEPADEGSSDPEETNNDDEYKIGEIFRIETNLFNYETPLCEKFKEFNYLLKIDLDVLTKDIEGFKTYEEYKDDWIYEWNKNTPWVHEKPWMNNGVWEEPVPVKHCCEPFNYKTGEWPTCSLREDGYCNGGNFPGAYIVGNSLHYQGFEWYEDLMDGELKEEALRNKDIMEGLINDDESSDEEDERHELCGDETHELPVCNIRRFKMIKYPFGDDEMYVAIKEDEYDNLMDTSKDTYRAYQEIFLIMDEGWM
ncbi:hypothetical protein Tco_1532996, partial [Tanacetum coccineum]